MQIPAEGARRLQAQKATGERLGDAMTLHNMTLGQNRRWDDLRTGIVAARRLLYLDHVGAQVRKQHGGGGPGEDAREVDDLDATQRWRDSLANM